MSQYPKYNPKNLLNHNYFFSHINYNPSRFLNLDSNFSWQTYCQLFSQKFIKQKSEKNEIKHKKIRTNEYIENILKQAINNAIHICKMIE